MKIIGLSGTNGSGKDTVAEIVANKFNYLFVSVSDLLRDEAAERGLAVEREVLRNISSEWRRKHGLGVLVDKAVQMYEDQGGDEEFSGLIIGSLRNPGEADRIHELKGKVVWVDADPEVRYDRIYSRQRTPEDNKTFEDFIEEEAAEMKQHGDEATLHIAAVSKESDRVIFNNGSTLQELENVIQKQIGNIL